MDDIIVAGFVIILILISVGWARWDCYQITKADRKRQASLTRESRLKDL
tara:strand:+ start:736 stop:882 length:147 start_codon:yes stop_codon:yes gene_type:complete